MSSPSGAALSLSFSVLTTAHHELFYVGLGLVEAGPLVMLDVRPGPIHIGLQIPSAASVLPVAAIFAWGVRPKT